MLCRLEGLRGACNEEVIEVVVNVQYALLMSKPFDRLCQAVENGAE